MLLDAHGNKLGDKNVQEMDSLARMKESNQALTDQRKLPNQELLANQEAAKGRVVRISDFLQTLQKLSPTLLFKESRVWNRPTIAIYDFSGEEPHYVSGFFTDTGYLPEYTSLTEKDERGLYSRTIRGWREVLVELIKKGAISVIGAESKLGKATGVRAAGAWDKQVQKYKN